METSLEGITNMAVASYSAGFVLGCLLDRIEKYKRELNNVVIKEFDGDEKLVKENKELSSKILLVEASGTITIGYLPKILEYVPLQKIFNYVKTNGLSRSLFLSEISEYIKNHDLIKILIEGGINAVATYLGVKSGEYASKIVRHSRRLKPEEASFLEQKLVTLTNLMTTDKKEESEELISKIGKYAWRIAIKTKNPAILMYLKKRMVEVLEQAEGYPKSKKSLSGQDGVSLPDAYRLPTIGA